MNRIVLIAITLFLIASQSVSYAEAADVYEHLRSPHPEVLPYHVAITERHCPVNSATVARIAQNTIIRSRLQPRAKSDSDTYFLSVYIRCRQALEPYSHQYVYYIRVEPSRPCGESGVAAAFSLDTVGIGDADVISAGLQKLLNVLLTEYVRVNFGLHLE